MEARHGRKLGSAAYEIAHDTEPPGRLAPEVSLSRIRGLTCEILAHAPTPSPFQFPLFPFLFLSTAVSPPFDNPLSLPPSLSRPVKHPSVPFRQPTTPAYLLSPTLSLFFSPPRLLSSPSLSLLSTSPPPPFYPPWLDKLLRMASCERQVSSVSPAWHGTLPSISPVSKFEWIYEGGEGVEGSINIGDKCRGRFLPSEDDDFRFLIIYILNRI